MNASTRVCDNREGEFVSFSCLMLLQTNESKRKAHRAYRLLLLVLFLRPFGNLSLAWGMKQFPSVLSVSPVPYILTMVNPFVSGGILLLVLATLVRMALLSVADLSFVVPLTAFGYVVTTFLGRFLLHEAVSTAGWLGTGLIFLGTAVVSSTATVTRQMKP